MEIMVDTVEGNSVQLHKLIGRPIPNLRRFVVLAAKLEGVGFSKFAAPEIAEVNSGRNSFNTAVKTV